jgi:hypothetical protein
MIKDKAGAGFLYEIVDPRGRFSSAQLRNFASDLHPFTAAGFSAIVRAC